ncbi:MAG: hemerythrin domain-containing protein [Planctomycetaceae bacterium]
MSRKTPKIVVNKLGQYTQMQYILLGDLREVLESRPTLSERNWMLSILDALLDTLPTQFSLREEGGYMTDVLEDFPSWGSQVERLRCEHGPLCDQLRTLRDRVASGSQYKQVAETVRFELRDWMACLQDHEQKECSLFLTAANQEIGVGD